jgi:hypothetical protein
VAKRTQGRFSRTFERVALGGIMTVVAFVVERRLLKVIRQRGDQEDEPHTDADPGAELRAPSS